MATKKKTAKKTPKKKRAAERTPREQKALAKFARAVGLPEPKAGKRGREKPVAKPLSRTKVRVQINAVVSGAFGHVGLPNFNMQSALAAGFEDAGYKLEAAELVTHPKARLRIGIAR